MVDVVRKNVWAHRADSRASRTAGNNSETSAPMMAMTINNSKSVNPRTNDWRIKRSESGAANMCSGIMSRHGSSNSFLSY
jgi:hypothetical protein